MKKKIRKELYKLYEKPPTTNKEKLIGDIWFAKVPYHEKGNFRYAMSVCSDIDKLCEQYEVEVPILIENVFHTGENIFFLNDYESSSVVFLEYLNMLEYYRDPEYNSECEAYVYLGLISEHSDEKRKAEKYFKKARKISEERTDYLLKYIADKIDN